MIRTQVYLHDQQYHLAKLMAAQEGSAFAEAVREGLDLWIAQQQKKQAEAKPKRAFDGYIGIFKDKPREPDMQIDDIYDDVLPWDRDARIKAMKKAAKKTGKKK